MTSEEFISEPIQPGSGTFHSQSMVKAEPGLPQRFRWRDQEYTIVEVLQVWKESGPDKDGSGQMYLRKHWYKVRTEPDLIMNIYFERQSRSKSQTKKRWWLYTLEKKSKI